MGLDMYLTKRTYVAAEYKHRNVKCKIDLSIEGTVIKIDPSKIHEISEKVCTWRKCNAIHQWFVLNIQGGKDDCEEYYVSIENIISLRELCERIIKDNSLAQSELPPTSGFFFGSNEIDEYYFHDLKTTVDMLSEISTDVDGYNIGFYYSSSW